jgi:hypothetical protein
VKTLFFCDVVSVTFIDNFSFLNDIKQSRIFWNNGREQNCGGNAIHLFKEMLLGGQ